MSIDIQTTEERDLQHTIWSSNYKTPEQHMRSKSTSIYVQIFRPTAQVATFGSSGDIWPKGWYLDTEEEAHGNGYKGLGKGDAKRHRKVLRDNIQAITKHPIRRLARRGGVKRIRDHLWTQGLPWERHQGCRQLHRAHQEEDRHCHGCGLDIVSLAQKLAWENIKY